MSPLRGVTAAKRGARGLGPLARASKASFRAELATEGGSIPSTATIPHFVRAGG